jgi:TPR repeat protein
MNGLADAKTGKWIIKQNLTKAIALLEYAADHGSLEASSNLAKLYINREHQQSQLKGVIQSNITKGFYYLNLSMVGDLPAAYHDFAEIVHYSTIKIPGNFVELYNLTSK